MTKTIDYYNENAEAFFAATATVDMAPVYHRFLHRFHLEMEEEARRRDDSA